MWNSFAIQLFKGLEAFDCKPKDKCIIQNVANAYEMLGRVQEKDRVLEKYSYVLDEKKSRKKRFDGNKISLSPRRDDTSNLERPHLPRVIR
ncbi:hypothetical protein K1719_023495 [Acacia pycnantha]|nr:hypothetical protein K1719_023495 [Acacia pycnantha]